MSNAVPVRPVGWRILVEPIEVKKQTESGIVFAEESVKAQEYLRYIGRVVDLGHLCYQKKDFGPDQKPWCEVGSYIAFGRHAGQEVIVNVDGGQRRYKLLNDDEVMAVIDDPAAIVTPF